MGELIEMKGWVGGRTNNGSHVKKSKRRLRVFAERPQYFPHEGGVHEMECVFEESVQSAVALEVVR